MDVTLEQIRDTLGCRATVLLNGEDYSIGRVIKTPVGDGRAEFAVVHRTEISGKTKLMYANLYPLFIKEMIRDSSEVIFDLTGIGGGVYEHRFPQEIPKVDVYLKEIGL